MFLLFFLCFFSTYIKMSKDLSAKYSQDNKIRLKENKLVKKIEIFLKNVKEKKRQYYHDLYKNLSDDHWV